MMLLFERGSRPAVAKSSSAYASTAVWIAAVASWLTSSERVERSLMMRRVIRWMMARGMLYVGAERRRGGAGVMVLWRSTDKRLYIRGVAPHACHTLRR